MEVALAVDFEFDFDLPLYQLGAPIQVSAKGDGPPN